MNGKKRVTAGIDIGGTNTVIGLVDKTGRIIEKASFLTKYHKTFKEYIDVLSKNINILLKKGEYYLDGIGIGAPNGNIFRGTIEYAANLEWKGILPAAELISKNFKVPIKVTNDANAAALGEKIFGKAVNTDNFIMITLGTGFGSGIVAGGNLIYGHSGFAGELGHIIAERNGRQCGCGRKGCLETYVSATGIMRTAKELINENKEKTFITEENINTLTSKDIYDFAKKGDKFALRIFDYTAKVLGKALADFVAFLSPEYIYFFGGPANAEDLLIESAEKYMNKNLLNVYKNTVKIEISGLKHGETAVLGAAALVRQNLSV